MTHKKLPTYKCVFPLRGTLTLIIAILAAVILGAVPSGCARQGYSAELCGSFASRGEGREVFTQEDYEAMVDQCHYIVDYLLESTQEIASIGDSAERAQAMRGRLADEDYMQRLGYMFTLSSLLYQADVAGRLGPEVRKDYRDLVAVTEEFAQLSSSI